MEIVKTPDVIRANYIKSILNFLFTLIMDDRSTPTLQTPFVLSLVKLGFVDQLLELVNSSWQKIESLRNEEDKDRIADYRSIVERSLNIMMIFCNSSMLMDSAHTNNLTREKDKSSPDYFDPPLHLVKMRLKVLPCVEGILNTPSVVKAESSTVKSLVQILVHIMKAEAEAPKSNGVLASLPGPVGPSHIPISSLAASIFGARNVVPSATSRTVVPDPDKVQQICDMGFPRAAAERALTLTGNNVSRAAEYLIMHPDVVAQASYSASGSTSTTHPGPSTTGAADSGLPTQTGPSSVNITEPSPTPVEAADIPMENIPASNLGDEPVVDDDGDENFEDMDDDEDDDDDDDDDVDVEDSEDELAKAIALSMGPPPKASDAKKEKDEAAVLKEQLDAKREALKASLFDLCFTLVSAVPDAIFEIKELIFLLGKDTKVIVKHIMMHESMNEMIKCHLSSGREVYQTVLKGMETLLRMLALIINYPRYLQDSIEALRPYLPAMVNTVKGHARCCFESDVDTSAIASLLLIIESCLSFSGEPQEEAAAYTADHLKTALLSGEVQSWGEPLLDTPTEKKSIDTGLLSLDDKSELLIAIFSYLKYVKNIGKDLLHATYRLMVHLTRSSELAIEFVKNRGVPLLFEQTRLVSFPAHQQLTMMILRHLVEEPAVLKKMFTAEIQSWFTKNRPRAVDLSSFIRNFSHLACRNPDVFISATLDICMLSKYDPRGNFSLVLKPVEENQEQLKDSSSKMEVPPRKTPLDEPSESGKEISVGPSDNIQSTMKCIVNRLIALKSSGSKSPDADATSTPLPASTPEDTHIQRCFLLQGLAELVTAYPECRKEVMNATQRKHSSKTPTKTSSKNGFFNYLMNELIMHDIKYIDNEVTDNADMETQMRLAENKWASKVLFGLCMHSSEAGKSNSVDSAAIQRVVLDSIAKSLKDAVSHSIQTSEERYGRYLALSELVYQLLSNKPVGSGIISSTRVAGEDSFQIAKIMLEKGFVNLLTGIIADLDVHHPASKALLAKFLKPLELLTKAATSLGSSSDEQGDSSTKTSEEHSVPAVQLPLESEDAGEISNIYRNSALSMFGPRSEQDDVHYSSGEDNEEGFEEFSDEDDDSMDDEDEVGV